MRRRWMAVAAGGLAGCLTVTPAAMADPDETAADDELASLADSPWRPPIDGSQFYFVLTDRFNDGDPLNNHGGFDPSESGYEPQDPNFYHGGDLAGLEEGLDYIADLGTEAIWITPPMTNKPMMVFFDSLELAAYHGYWTLDLTTVDPHLGGDEAMRSFIDAAHERGIKVFFDIEINTTADIIEYAEGEYEYVPTEQEPYRDAQGSPIDLAELAGSDSFPQLDPQASFPYTPVIPEGWENMKFPDWLNDPTLYHNRGDSTFDGESVTYGDFMGLDDLMTEHPRVVEGMIDVYKKWIDFGVDGFRIDTVKHVNLEFWQEWSVAIMDHARSIGRDDFFMFGEVLEFDQWDLAPYVRATDIGGVLDFSFAGTVIDFVNDTDASILGDFFALDDVYTTANSSAYALQTFISNHDLGRIGQNLATRDDGLERSLLAHDVLMLSRGMPIVYYGDEQGFTGGGQDAGGNDLPTDVASRQDMFGTQVPGYQEQTLLNGEPFGSAPHFDQDAAIYQRVSTLGQLRDAHPGLATGAQVELAVDVPQHVYAMAKVDREDHTEYVVAFNNSTGPIDVQLDALTPDADFDALLGASAPVTSDADGRITVTVPALGTVILRGDSAVPAQAVVPEVQVAAEFGEEYVEITASIDEEYWAETTFAWREACQGEWMALGTSDRSAPRVFASQADFPAQAPIEIGALVRDADGGVTSAVNTYEGGQAVESECRDPEPTPDPEPTEDPEPTDPVPTPDPTGPVATDPAPTDPAPTPGATDGAGGSDEMAETGVNPVPLVALSVLLCLGGVLVVRRVRAQR